MMTVLDRQAGYEQIRRRFVDDPEFRAEMRADPVGVLTTALGELTEDERRWAEGISVGDAPAGTVVGRLRQFRQPRAW